MKSRTPLRALVILFAGLGWIQSVDGDTVDGNDGAPRDATEHFEKQVRPLLIEHCYECHSLESGKQHGGLALDSREGWSEGGDSGPAIVPGDAESSLLIRAVRYDDDIQMPPDGKLDARQIRSLETWIASGAFDPRSMSDAGKGDGSDDSRRVNPADPIAGREHWVFAPLVRPSPVKMSYDRWSRSGIDSFVFAGLQAQGLNPASDADRATLIRRLSFQLLGLPPGIQEVDAFVADERADAYSRLVDDMLSSPAFAERWGRHWLDLARYADSNGLDENFLFRQAWRYRNWVIDAINHDMPFDRFQREQVAGDLLPYETVEQRDKQRIAAGFLVVGPKVLLGNDRRERRMDIADEQLDTVGKTFLGMTLGCARCHDHKFDPIPTSDYYALAGIFTSTQVLERRYMLGEQREMEQLIGLGENGDQLDSDYESYWRNESKLKQRLAHAKSALEHLQKQEDEAFNKLAEEQGDSIADAAKDPEQSIGDRLAAQSQLVDELTHSLQPPEVPPRAMIPSDVEAPADEAIRLSGQFNRLGKVVPRGALRVIGDAELSIADGHSGRRELADWMVDVDQGAGRVVARVIANRIWYHLMGRGLVRTVDNFGRTGESPSHPELLDYLASELIESGWSIKALVREIVTSRTFQMSSRHDANSHSIDPENQWYWRANRRRVDPESLRDAMLLVGDQLDRSPMDSSVWYLGDQATAVGSNKNRRRTDFPSRSVYLPVIRNDLPELFDSFDFADPHATTGMRPQTMVATQGFFLMNDPSVMAAADAIVSKAIAGSHDSAPLEIAERLSRVVLSGYTDENLQEELVRFVESAKAWAEESGQSMEETAAWSAACHALLASSRFQIVE